MNVKILSWNVNGLRSILAKGLHKVLEEHPADIVCLQETKIQDSQLDEIADSLPQGNWIHSPATKKGYSGVAIFHQASKNPPLTIEAKGIGKSHFDSEGRFILARHKNFTLYNIYFPSGTSGEERQKFKYTFLDALYDHFDKLPKAEKKRLIVCGDFNICHREIDIHHPDVATKRQLTGFLPDERKWMDSFCELGFTDTFRHFHGDTPHQYTWWSYRAGARKKNLGWRIDYFFVANELQDAIHSVEILGHVQGSDHCPMLLNMKF